MSGVLVVDHRDSFVSLLAEAFRCLGAEVGVFRADELGPGDLEQRVTDLSPDLVVLSPGPGHPRAAHASLAWLATGPSQPVLGVCLGHQAMVLAAGGEVGQAREPVHGRASRLAPAEDPLLAGVRDVGRYHSLVATSLPPDLIPVAVTDGSCGPPELMALRHRHLPWVGLQFHPESVLTPSGPQLLERVLDWATSFTPSAPRS